MDLILQTRFNFKADYPYKMPDAELYGWNVSTYLIVGEKDKLIPHKRTIERAKTVLKDLRDIHVLKNVGHGIEMSKKYNRIAAQHIEQFLVGSPT